MALFLALSMLAAAQTTAPANGARPAPVSAPAQAFVRILPAARIVFAEMKAGDREKLTDAVVTVEDGSRRDAKLVEFQ